MITKEMAIAELARLDCLRFPPQSAVGMEELVSALMQSARSPSHAKRVIGEIIAHSPEGRWPTPGSIRDVAWSLLSEDEQHAGTGCKRCSGVGWLHVQRGKYSAVQECGCRPKAVTA